MLENRAGLGLPLLHALDRDRDAVGDLLPQEQQHLFADQLGGKHLLGLIADRVIGEEVRAFKGKARQDGDQLVHALAGQRTDRQNGGKVILLLPCGNAGEQRALILEQVGLVQHQNGGQSRFFELLEQRKLRFPRRFTRLGDEHADIHARDGFTDGLYHKIAETGAGTVVAGRVQKHELGLHSGSAPP